MSQEKGRLKKAAFSATSVGIKVAYLTTITPSLAAIEFLGFLFYDVLAASKRDFPHFVDLVVP